MTNSQMLQILQTYPDYRKRDSWLHQGSQTVDNTTTTYYGGNFYVVNELESDLNGALILCLDPIFSAIDWLQYRYVNNNIQRIDTLHIPTEFVLALSVEEYNAIDVLTYPEDSSFVPFQDLPDTTPSVIIPEYELQRILRDAGVPFVTWDELEYDVDTIKSLIVRPALELYYKYFPRIVPVEVPIGANGKFSADIPNDPNFTTVVRCFGTNSSQEDSSLGIGSAFTYYRDTMLGGMFMGGNAFGVNTASGRRRTSATLKFNHNDVITNSLNVATYNTLINRYARVKYTRTIDNKVEGFHTGARYVTIEFGYMSPNWDDVRYERKDEVRNLATAFALKTFGSLRNMTPNDHPGKIDYSSWITDGKELQAKIETHWNEFTKAMVVRSR